MGKYMRKAEATGDVAVMDGVRTRAKTLALRRLQSSAAAPSSEIPDSYSYLELRSRRLEKLQTSRKVRRSCRCTDGLLPSVIEVDGLEIEASLGENVLDTEDRERDTRESTSCSSTMGSNPGSAPGSSAASRRGALNSLFANVSPTPFELEEFFTREEQALQCLFTEKYNFDFVRELPLPGRYDWVKVSP